MQLNTLASIALGRRLHRAFGSWSAVRAAAVKGEDGVYRITPAQLDEALAAKIAQLDLRMHAIGD